MFSIRVLLNPNGHSICYSVPNVMFLFTFCDKRRGMSKITFSVSMKTLNSSNEVARNV